MDITTIIKVYQSLHLHEVIDHERFNEYAIVHHSSAIEGSTLTENETRLLLEENVTPKGKPLEHSLMIRDHYAALRFTLREADAKKAVSSTLIQSINAAVMKSTGSVYYTPLGTVDATRVEFRKGNVSAGGSYFVNYDKVEPYTRTLAEKLSTALGEKLSVEQQTELAFSAHFDLVTIHPFYDGNGRTSRLLMNYVQQYFRLPLAIVFKEDKADYFEALQQSRKHDDTTLFITFMKQQYAKHLRNEIQLFNDMKQENNTRPGRKNRPGFSIFY